MVKVHLIFNVHAGGAHPLQLQDGTSDVEWAAKARVDVHQERQLAHPGTHARTHAHTNTSTLEHARALTTAVHH
jgi:hypothetical protein